MMHGEFHELVHKLMNWSHTNLTWSQIQYLHICHIVSQGYCGIFTFQSLLKILCYKKYFLNPFKLIKILKIIIYIFLS